MQYIVKYDTKSWSCEDGCCDNSVTKLHINDKHVSNYDDFRDFDAVDKMIQMLNEDDEELELMFTIESDVDGDLEDVICFNNEVLCKGFRNVEVFQNILDHLNLKYRYITYNLDWDVWKDDKRIVLIVDKDRMVNS